MFARNQGGADNWGQVKKLLPPQGFLNGNFGASVGVTDDVIAVGAPGASVTGVVYLYARNQGGVNNWVAERSARRVAGSWRALWCGPGARWAVLTGGRAIGGYVRIDSGSIYSDKRHDGGVNNWGQVQKVAAGINSTAGQQFGSAIAFDSGIAVIGAPAYAGGRGLARYMRFSDDRMSSFAHTIGDAVGDAFGTSVAINADEILIGAPLFDTPTLRDVGMVVAFTVTQLRSDENRIGNRLTPRTRTAGERFGTSVAIGSSLSSVGAAQANGPGAAASGRVHLDSAGGGNIERGALVGSDARGRSLRASAGHHNWDAAGGRALPRHTGARQRRSVPV